NMEADTVIQLSKHPNIIGVKEASAGNMDQLSRILEGTSGDFLVTSGDDDLIIPFMERGGHGVISVIANALPSETVALVKSCLAGDFAQAQKDNEALQPFLDLIFTEGNPTGIKSLLKAANIGNGLLRLPLVEASDALDLKIKQAYKTLKTKKGAL